MMRWTPTTTRVSTERGRPDPVSDLVEVARKQGQFRRVRVGAARPHAPIALVAGAMVFGAGGDFCDPPEPSGQHGHCGGLDLLAMAITVAGAESNYRIFLHSGLKAMFNS